MILTVLPIPLPPIHLSMAVDSSAMRGSSLSHSFISPHILHDTGPGWCDMFADEDTWQFGGGSVYAVGGDRSEGSSWSLQSMGAAIGSIGVGVRGMMSRQNSGNTDPAQDQFLDGEVAAIMPHSRQQTLYLSDLIYEPSQIILSMKLLDLIKSRQASLHVFNMWIPYLCAGSHPPSVCILLCPSHPLRSKSCALVIQ
jgi:hypothetical protein